MRKLLLLALVAACGSEEPPTSASSVKADGVRRIVVTGESGSLRLDTGAGGEITYIAAEGAAHTLRNGTLHITHKGGGELRLVAPGGLDLVARLAEGDIGVGGKWGSIDIDTVTGSVRVFVSALAGGTIDTMKGDITLDCRVAPKQSVSLTAVTGDVVARIAPAFRGLVQAAAPKGELHLPPQLHRRNTDVGAMVFAGTRFSKEELAEVPADKRPGIWLTSKRGDVTFQLE